MESVLVNETSKLTQFWLSVWCLSVILPDHHTNWRLQHGLVEWGQVQHLVQYKYPTFMCGHRVDTYMASHDHIYLLSSCPAVELVTFIPGDRFHCARFMYSVHSTKIVLTYLDALDVASFFCMHVLFLGSKIFYFKLMLFRGHRRRRKLDQRPSLQCAPASILQDIASICFVTPSCSFSLVVWSVIVFMSLTGPPQCHSSPPSPPSLAHVMRTRLLFGAMQDQIFTAR